MPEPIAYGVSIVVVALATVVRLALGPFLGPVGSPYVTYLLANAIAMRYLGLGPSVLTILLGGLSADWLFIPPLYSLELNLAHLVPFTLFLLANVVLLTLTEGLRKAKDKAEENAKKLLANQQMLQLRADIIQSLQHAAPMRNSLQRVADLLVKGLDAAFARIWTLDASGQVLELQASSGLYTHINGAHARIPVGQYKIGLIAQERRPHVTNQVIGDPRVHDQEWARREAMLAFAGFPLLVEDRILGVVALFARHELSPSVNDILEAVAGILAQALARKQAEEELHKAKDDLAVTNQTLEQKVLERTRKLEQTHNSLEGILYHVAHDLRAPLRAMHSFTEILMRRYAPKYDKEGAELSERVLESTQRMDQLISDLLNYGRLCHKQISLEAVDLDRVLGKVLYALNTQMAERNAELQIDRPLPAVWGNEAVLEQILWNLLSNAVKFVTPHARPRIHIWAETNDEHVSILIQDNGIGIPPEYQDKVFGVFESLHRPSEYPGTGIGLAMVKKGAELLEGTITLHSKAGGGTKATLNLKLAPSSALPMAMAHCA